jgi:hypothetical protein
MVAGVANQFDQANAALKNTVHGRKACQASTVATATRLESSATKRRLCRGDHLPSANFKMATLIYEHAGVRTFYDAGVDTYLA